MKENKQESKREIERERERDRDRKQRGRDRNREGEVMKNKTIHCFSGKVIIFVACACVGGGCW